VNLIVRCLLGQSPGVPFIVARNQADPSMPLHFDQDGIHVTYPDNWRLEQEENEDGWTATIQSPGTAFALLCLRADHPEPADMTATALEVMREEYEQVDAEETVAALAGQPAVGHDIHFYSLDLTNTCWTRSLTTPQGTLLVMCQINDLELDQHEAVLRAICASLRIDEE